MLNILLIDDNPEKVIRIQGALQINFDFEIHIDVAHSSIIGKSYLTSNDYDLLIIDQYLPAREGDHPSAEESSILLKEILNQKRFNKPTHIIGITAFSSSESFESYFASQLWAIISYCEHDDGWKHKLRAKVEYIANSKKFNRDSIDGEYKLGVIAALPRPEFSELLKISTWEKLQEPGSEQIYQTSLPGLKNEISTIAISLPQMGMAAAATATALLVHKHNPEYIAMIGITAGVKGRVNIGDIIITDPSWDWGSGKITSKCGVRELLPQPEQERLHPFPQSIFRDILCDDDFLTSEWQSYSESQKPSSPPKIHLGPSASGASVITDSTILDEIMLHHRKLIGIEMEGYGVMYASRQASMSECKSFVIKSVCDFANGEKNDEYQQYCAFISASFLKKIAAKYL